MTSPINSHFKRKQELTLFNLSHHKR